MDYTVYILYSSSQDRFYKGQTQDLIKRIDRHNKGYEKFTKSGAPWQLLWSTSKPTRGEATKLEAKLKNLKRMRLLDFMIKYEEGVAGTDELLLIKQLSAW